MWKGISMHNINQLIQLIHQILSDPTLSLITSTILTILALRSSKKSSHQKKINGVRLLKKRKSPLEGLKKVGKLHNYGIVSTKVDISIFSTCMKGKPLNMLIQRCGRCNRTVFQY